MAGNQDGAKVRELREARDMTRKDLAAQLGTTAETVRNIEVGYSTSVKRLVKLADVLETSLLSIVRRDTDLYKALTRDGTGTAA